MNRAVEMLKLSRQAAGMSTENHGRYLAELLRWYRHASMRGPVDPVAALDLLVALWKTPFAGRPEELKALNDVGRWLDECLVEDPALTAAELAWKMGWLRRIAHADQDDTRRRPFEKGETGRFGGGREEPQRGYGLRIDAIRRRRTQAAAAGAAGPAAASRSAPATAQGALETASLLRAIDKGSAAAKVPDVLKTVPEIQRAAVARDILKKLDRKWVEARKEKAWAAELLAAAAQG